MTESEQDGLNLLARVCTETGGRITPRGYHLDRLRCAPFAICDDVLDACGEQRARLVRSPDIKRIAALFDHGTPPAGGWYLVKEQRRWLERRLVQAFEALASQRDELTLLEAGVGGHVHHLTYMNIVRSALRQVPDIEVTVVVADRCVLPLAAVRELTAHPAAERVYAGGIEIRAPAELRPALLDDVGGRLRTRTCVVDLQESAAVSALDGVDVITEHFLTSLLDKHPLEVEPVRETYAKVLRPGGVLLTADGFGRSSADYVTYVALHERLGFRCGSSGGVGVWDPYGLPRRAITEFVVGLRERLDVSLNNTLSVFERVAE